jgi:thiamine pyrophosphate-dependent acetolactate synthase large subunit-like protein
VKVYEALTDAFVAEGMTELFGVLGDGNMAWLNALRSHHPQVRCYDVRHEGPGLSMADAYARVTGRPGVCTVTSGPGVTQLPTSLVMAARARSPVVVFASDTPLGNDLAVQRLDERRVAEASETLFVRLEVAEQAHQAVRNAFNLARVESRPVMLSVPTDVQAMECDLGPYEPSASLSPGAQRVQPDAAQVESAARLIAASRKPVIVAGRGAVASGAGEVILKLGERIGALIANTLLTKGWLIDAPYHAGICGLFATRGATECFTEADCVIGVGASLNHFTIESGYLFQDARFVQIDLASQVIMGNGRIADCYLRADARTGVEALLRALDGKPPATGFRTPEVLQALSQPVDTATFEIEPGTVDPREVADCIDETLPQQFGLVIGSGHQKAFVAMQANRKRDLVMTTSQFGTIGQGVGLAIGATVASKKPAVLVEGDAGTIMHVQELDTMRRYKIPLMILVNNDEALGAEYHDLRSHGQNVSIALQETPDLAAVARGFGCRGHLARSVGEVRAALDEFVADPAPTLLDVRVSRNVVSIPERRLQGDMSQ